MALLEKFELQQGEKLIQAILDLYTTQGWAVVSFLYFANMMKARLLEGTPQSRQKQYYMALIASDFLLADGIALQLFYRWSQVGRKNQSIPPNNNGTDFIPKFFDVVVNDPNVHVSLMMFWDEKIGKGPEYAQLANTAFEEKYGRSFNHIWQTNYANRSNFVFDRNGYESSLRDEDTMRIMFVCLGTPAQEVWVMNHMDAIKKYGCLVFNAGGTIDYMTGLEKRAPARVVKARVLETLWRITTHPHKNLRKFLAMFGIIRYRIWNVKKGMGITK